MRLQLSGRNSEMGVELSSASIKRLKLGRGGSKVSPQGTGGENPVGARPKLTGGRDRNPGERWRINITFPSLYATPWCALNIDASTRRNPLPEAPRVLQIQTISGCNADCVFCPNKKTEIDIPLGRRIGWEGFIDRSSISAWRWECVAFRPI